jgi:hypothetical protein
MKNKFYKMLDEKLKLEKMNQLENELKLNEETKYRSAFAPYSESEEKQDQEKVEYRSVNKSANNKGKNKFKYFAMFTIFALLATYLGGVFYYKDKYTPNTYINTLNVSGQSLVVSEEEKLKILQNDILVFRTPEAPDGKKVSIYNSPIKIEFDPITQANESNNPWLWFTSFFAEKKYKLKLAVRDEQDVDNWLKIQGVTNNDNRVVPESASVGYENGKVIIKPENQGNAIDEKKAKEKLISSIQSANFDVDFRNEKMKVERDELSVKKLQSEVANIVESKTVIKGPKEIMEIEGQEKFDSLKINPDDTIEYKQEEIAKIIKKYNEQIKSAAGIKSETVNLQVSGGSIQGGEKLIKLDQVDDQKSVDVIGQGIISSSREIKVQTVSKNANKVTYNGTAVTDGMFAEVDINQQRTYVYKDGEILINTPVVTGRSEAYQKDGKEVAPTPTNKGLFRVIGKYTNFTLDSSTVNVADEYKIKVNYWIPFDPVGIGFHDLAERENNPNVPADQRFGPDRYKQYGSHGCINTPLSNVEKMYNTLQAGTYVWVH